VPGTAAAADERPVRTVGLGANGVLFALNHLHVPWMIPLTLLDMVIA